MTCAWCNECLLDSERNPNTPMLDMHVECGLRAILGSLAHMQGCCGCYVAGSEEEDPPGLTPREAAKAAYEYWFSLDAVARFRLITRERLK